MRWESPADLNKQVVVGGSVMRMDNFSDTLVLLTTKSYKDQKQCIELGIEAGW